MPVRRAAIVWEDGIRRVSCPCGYAPDDPKAITLHECPLADRPRCGPGCQLKRSLEWFGIREGGGCGCQTYADQMDAWGADGCEERLEEIVAHLAGEAEKRSTILGVVPVLIISGLVRRAIDAARSS